MRIEFVRSGGFAGIRLAGHFDTAELPDKKARMLERLVKAAKFFELPEKLTAAEPGPDRFEYRVVVLSGESTHTVVVSEATIPDRLRPLLDYLTEMVRSGSSA